MDEEEEGISLVDLLMIMLKHKWMILSIVVLSGILAVAASSLMTKKYRSECTIAPASQEKGLGGLAALGGLGAALASDAGLLPAGSLEQFEVVLKSRDLTNAIIEKHNLMPVLYEDSWDSGRQCWKVKKPPTIQDAYRDIQKILIAAPDKRKNVMKVSVEFRDPLLAQAILNYYIAGMSEFLRKQTLEDAAAQQAQLYQQLGRTSDPLLKNKLYEMIAKQIEKETIARVQKYFSFSIIDSAFIPEKKSSPNRLVICVVSVVAAFIFAFFLALFIEYWRNLTRKNSC